MLLSSQTIIKVFEKIFNIVYNNNNEIKNNKNNLKLDDKLKLLYNLAIFQGFSEQTCILMAAVSAFII